MGRRFVPMVAFAAVGGNKDASLTLAEYGDCAYRVIGKQQLCATASSPQ
ncbi:hypothetical protein [Dactylosporangium sp. NPDC049140]